MARIRSGWFSANVVNPLRHCTASNGTRPIISWSFHRFPNTWDAFSQQRCRLSAHTRATSCRRHSYSVASADQAAMAHFQAPAAAWGRNCDSLSAASYDFSSWRLMIALLQENLTDILSNFCSCSKSIRSLLKSASETCLAQWAESELMLSVELLVFLCAPFRRKISRFHALIAIRRNQQQVLR